MALVWADLVADTSTTTGTGNFTVSGTSSLTAGQTFGGACATNDVFYGAITNRSANEWETGLYTYNGSNIVIRTLVLKSSNANALVNFSAGTKDVVLVSPASISSNNAMLNNPYSPCLYAWVHASYGGL